MKIIAAAVVICTAAGFTTTAQAEGEKIIYVTPNPIGNNAFLRLGRDGTEAAAAAMKGTAITYESDSPPAMLENLYAAVGDGANIVVAISFSATDGVMEVAPTAPDVDFLIVDACPQGDRPSNVHCAVFREHEASFMMGFMAAKATQTGKLGVVGPIDIPFMHRFTDSFADGAHYVNPDLDVQVRWVGGQNPFSDPVRAKEQALALHAQGADVINAAAAGGSFGVYEAAVEAGFKVFGVDSNLCEIAKGAMIDSALKGVDQAILQSVEKIAAGEDSVFASYGLKEKGVGAIALEDPAAIADSGCLIADMPAIAEDVRALAAKIIAGEVVVNDPLMAN
ncbi:MAG: BMP family ABC transporter substrate-binding protein [Hyphomicrobiales bacterium]|nr:BMP family ABC transporter substrate-binding protein [Nitratireductor sp.]MCC2098498.1 BMP family ABC transporter substrate-binding protein [Hyphomicrobiales bacterium]